MTRTATYHVLPNCDGGCQLQMFIILYSRERFIRFPCPRTCRCHRFVWDRHLRACARGALLVVHLDLWTWERLRHSDWLYSGGGAISHDDGGMLVGRRCCRSRIPRRRGRGKWRRRRRYAVEGNVSDSRCLASTCQRMTWRLICSCPTTCAGSLLPSKTHRDQVTSTVMQRQVLWLEE